MKSLRVCYWYVKRPRWRCVEHVLRLMLKNIYTPRQKQRPFFLFLIFENFPIGGMFSILETI